jgi:alkylhydroperoxidase/carboxymuconolactone decarboxylase family protein YurZ
VRLAGLVALGSETASLHAAVDAAHRAGAADEEILELVVAVAPLVGVSRISSALPGISMAMDRD